MPPGHFKCCSAINDYLKTDILQQHCFDKLFIFITKKLIKKRSKRKRRAGKVAFHYITLDAKELFERIFNYVFND